MDILEFLHIAIWKIAEWINFDSSGFLLVDSGWTGFLAAFWWEVGILLLTCIIRYPLKLFLFCFGWLLRERLTGFIANAIIIFGFVSFGIMSATLFIYCWILRGIVAPIFFVGFCFVFRWLAKQLDSVLFPGIEYLPPWYR